MLAAALLACVCGFAWLALAMEPHWRQVRGDAPISRRVATVLRVLGAAAKALLEAKSEAARLDHERALREAVGLDHGGAGRAADGGEAGDRAVRRRFVRLGNL